jgi:hypothetical protein
MIDEVSRFVAAGFDNSMIFNLTTMAINCRSKLH